MTFKDKAWEILNRDVREFVPNLDTRAVKSAIVALGLSALSLFSTNPAQALETPEKLPEAQNIEQVQKTESSSNLLVRLRKVRDERNSDAIETKSITEIKTINQAPAQLPASALETSTTQELEHKNDDSSEYKINASASEINELNSLFDNQQTTEPLKPSKVTTASKLPLPPAPWDLPKVVTNSKIAQVTSPKTETQQSDATKFAPLKMTPQEVHDFKAAFGENNNPQTSIESLDSPTQTEAQKKLTQQSTTIYQKKLIEVAPSVFSPTGQVGTFNPDKKTVTQVSAQTNPANITLNRTTIESTFTGTSQEKMQIISEVRGNTQKIKPIATATIENGEIITDTTTDYLTVGEIIPGGPNLPKNSGNFTIDSTIVQAPKDVTVILNGETFNSQTFPNNPADAFSKPAIDGNVIKLFPSNINPDSDIRVGATVSDDFASGKIYNQAGISSFNSLPKNTQEYLMGNLTPEQATSEYITNSFAFNMGDEKTSNLRTIDTKTIQPYLVQTGTFGYISAVNFNKKDASARIQTSYRQFNPLNLVVDTDLNVDTSSTIKNTLVGLPGLLPLNPELQQAVEAQKVAQAIKPVTNASQLTLDFQDKEKKLGPQSVVNLRSGEKAASLLNTMDLSFVSAKDAEISTNGTSYSGYSLSFGGKDSGYNFSEVNYGPKKEGNKTISALNPPTFNAMDNVYSIFSYTDNVTGETVYNRAALPVGITGGFGTMSVDQTTTTPFTKTSYIGTDTNPAAQISGVIGNDRGSLAASVGASLNPFPNQLAGGISHKTPAVMAWLSAKGQYAITTDQRLKVLLNANFTTDPRPDSPNVASAALLYRFGNGAVSLGAAYLGGGSSTSTSIIPVAGARLEFGKATVLGNLSGNTWSINPKYQISPSLGIGAIIGNSSQFNNIPNNNAENQSGIHYGVQADININRNIRAKVYGGTDGQSLSVEYKQSF